MGWLFSPLAIGIRRTTAPLSNKEVGGRLTASNNTRAQNFPPVFNFPSDIHILSKATTREKDAYSGFADTPLNALLKSFGIGAYLSGGSLQNIVCSIP